MIRAISAIALLLLLNSCSKELHDVPGKKPAGEQELLSLNRSSLAFNGLVNVADSFTVEFNGAWSIQLDSEASKWLQLSQTSATGQTKIYVKALQLNTTSAPRSATILVSPDNNTIDPDTIIITQQVYTFAPWQRLYGGSNFDGFDCISMTADSGFIAVGSTNSSDGDVSVNPRASGLWAVKLDVAGNILWEKTYSIPQYLRGTRIVSANGGYAILGQVEVPHDGRTILMAHLTKVDEIGVVVWEKILPLNPGDDIIDIKPVSTGGFICAGTGNVPGMNNNAILMRLNDNGNVTWQKNYGGVNFDRVASVDETADGGFIAAGNTDSYVLGTQPTPETVDTYVVKVDGSGTLLWEQQCGGSKMDIGERVISTMDGGFLISSMSVSDASLNSRGDYDIVISRLNSAGTLMWQRSYGSSGPDGSSDIVEIDNGQFLLSGEVNSADGDVTHTGGFSDAWLVKISATGDILWQQSFGGTNYDHPRCLLVADGKLLIAGHSSSTTGLFSSNHGNTDAWVIATEIP